jgi:hypothetical protein
MKISKVTCQNLTSLLPVLGIIALIFLAGIGQAATDQYLQSQLSNKIRLESMQRIEAYQALMARVEEYQHAFVNREYDTMYRLSYFKGVPEPSLIEYRQLRDAGYVYHINVTVQDIEVQGDKAWVELELVLTHPALGTNKTIHRQKWELHNGLWYKVDYGN